MDYKNDDVVKALEQMTNATKSICEQNLEMQKSLMKNKQSSFATKIIIVILGAALIISIFIGYLTSYKQFDRMATAFENQTITVDNSYSVPSTNNTNINNANGSINSSSSK